MMTELRYSDHACRRLRQRGLRHRDVDLLLACGTQIDEASILLSNKDAAREIKRRRREIQQLERLRGCQVVVAERVIVTCYHSERRKLQKKLRRGS